jgi:hypothetical protein
MGISFLKKKRFSPFERRFPYLLLCNFSDGTGWKILRGAWNLRGRRDTKIQVIEVSVSSLYYLFFVIILITVYNTDHSNFHLLFDLKNIFHRMSHEKLSARERRKAGKIYCKSLYIN